MSHCAFRFLLHQKHSLYVHHLLKKCVKMLALIFFFKFCLFVSKVCSVFLSHNLRFRYTKNILCTFTNCSKNFVKMLALIFKSLVISKVCFCHTPCFFLFLLHQKHFLYVHQLLIKFSMHTMLFSVSVTPTTFFFCENTIR